MDKMLNCLRHSGQRRAMEINGFHRGSHHWIAEFILEGRQRVAFYDRQNGRWYFAHMSKFDPMTLGEIESELTDGLKKYLKEIGILTE